MSNLAPLLKPIAISTTSFIWAIKIGDVQITAFSPETYWNNHVEIAATK